MKQKFCMPSPSGEKIADRNEDCVRYLFTLYQLPIYTLSTRWWIKPGKCLKYSPTLNTSNDNVMQCAGFIYAGFKGHEEDISDLRNDINRQEG